MKSPCVGSPGIEIIPAGGLYAAKYRQLARTDNDFDSIRDRSEFQERLAEID